MGAFTVYGLGACHKYGKVVTIFTVPNGTGKIEVAVMRGRRTPKAKINAGYCRVSTVEQAEHGVSLEAQRLRVLAMAEGHGLPLGEVFVDDGFSGATMDRPAMKRLRAMIERREIAAVFVVKIDRLTRSLRDMLDLIDLCDRTGTRLVSATESLDTGSAMGRMVLQLISAFAELERGMASERTMAALDYKRRARKVYGAVPFGYRRDGDALVEVPEEQAALAEMRTLYASGATLRQIGAMLDARGLRPHRGKAWHPSTVSAILTSRMNAEAV